MALGAADDPQLAGDVSAMLARELRALGINWDYAPVVDLTHNIENISVGTRSPGSDRDAVSRIVAAEVRGFQRERVAASAKHFPGLGNTPVDTHLALAVIEGELDYLWDQDLVPFRAAVAAGVASVMVSHVKFAALDAEYPATLSPVIVQRLLREEMGYTGIACSDSMEMKAISDHYGAGKSAVLAALAGLDLLHYSHYVADQEGAYNALLDAARSGRLPLSVIDAANARIAAFKTQYAVTDAAQPVDHPQRRSPRAGAARRPRRDGAAQERRRVPAVRRSAECRLGRVRLLSQLRGAGSRRSGELLPADRGARARFQQRIAQRQRSQAGAAGAGAESRRQRRRAGRSDAQRSRQPGAARMARDLLGRAKRSILICLRNPYDAGVLEADAVICTCGDSTPSLAAAADALLGRLRADRETAGRGLNLTPHPPLHGARGRKTRQARCLSPLS